MYMLECIQFNSWVCVCVYMYVYIYVHSCRHEVIANYFGDPKPKCGKSCDFCQNPLALKEAVRDMKLCQGGGKGTSVGGTGMGNFERGEPDWALYGGGRWGYKRYVVRNGGLLLSYC